jgi:pantoate--beta-alanine ligase
MSLEALREVAAARRWCEQVRAAGESLGFVPTMGALHEGHLSLVARAARENRRSCVSIFVYPMQFDDAGDLERYPRDFEGDAWRLEEAGCDMLFTGSLADFFPEVADATAERIPRRDPGPRALGLEGAHRPGHFAGVATIVARLFEIVRPTRAYFGAKDYQQTLVVRDLAAQLGYPEIVTCPTSREPGGLARSSRNELLAPADREHARGLCAALRATARAWRDGERDAGRLRELLHSELRRLGLEPDYAELRDPDAWSTEAPSGPLRSARAFVAVTLGGVRLIDNMALDEEADPA